MKMNGDKFTGADDDASTKRNRKNDPKSKTKRNSEKIRFRMAKSEECPECLANGLVAPFKLENYKKTESAGDSDVCKCSKCHPDRFSQGDDENKEEGAAPEPEPEPDSASRSALKFRARSWPLLVPPDDSKKDPKSSEIGLPSPVAQVRRLLWRHYYPEGGWGYVVVACCVLVNVINHGLQLAYGVLHKPILDKFRVGILETGEKRVYRE